MLNRMSENKGRKRVEFKIEKEIKREPENPKGQSPVNQVIRKTSLEKNEQMIVIEVEDLNCHNRPKEKKNEPYFKLLSANDKDLVPKKSKFKASKDEKGEVMLKKKRMRNPSTNSRSSLVDEEILNYDQFLEVVYGGDEKEKKKNECIKKKKPTVESNKLPVKNNLIITHAHDKKAANQTSQQVMKLIKNKQKKKGRRNISTTKNSKIYDIDNFVIQSNALRIHQRHEKLDIPIPIYKEIGLCEEWLSEVDTDKEEDVSDEVYVSFHNLYEQRERDYSLSLLKKKKSTSKLMPTDKGGKGDKADQVTLTGVSISDSLTAKSNDDLVNSNLKIRINLNVLSTDKVKI